MKILHFADLHARDKDIDEVSKCLGFIVSKAQEERPNLIVFAGDAFHSRDVKLDSEAARLVIRSFSQLADIAPVAAVIGTPSHDGKAPEILNMVRGKFPVHVSILPEQIYLFRGAFLNSENATAITPEVVISMLPQPTKEYFSRTTESSIVEGDQEVGGLLGGVFMGFGAMADEFRAPHILVGHFTVKGSVTSTGQQMIGREIEVTREALDLARADLVCLGHIHASQKIGNNVFYSGSVYRENFGEQEDKGFYIHDIGMLGDSRFIKTPTKRLMKREIDLTDGGIIEGLEKEELKIAFSGNDFLDSHVRVEIKTYQDEAALIDRAAIEKLLIESGAESVDIRIIRVPRETVRSTEIMKLSTLRDKIEELAKTRGEGVPASILEKADLVERLPQEQILERVSNGLGIDHA